MLGVRAREARLGRGLPELQGELRSRNVQKPRGRRRRARAVGTRVGSALPPLQESGIRSRALVPCSRLRALCFSSSPPPREISKTYRGPAPRVCNKVGRRGALALM